MAGGGELERLAAEIAGLREEVSQLSEAIKPPSQDRYLTTREVADMFRISYDCPAPCRGWEVARHNNREAGQVRARGDRSYPAEPSQACPGASGGQLGGPAAEQAASGSPPCGMVITPCSRTELPSRGKGSSAVS